MLMVVPGFEANLAMHLALKNREHKQIVEFKEGTIEKWSQALLMTINQNKIS